MSGTDLATAVNGIIGAIINELATAQASTLKDVVAISRGDRSRGRQGLPMLWVLPEVANPTSTRLSMAEEWEMSVNLVALVKEDDPATGNQNAISLAARARNVILTGNRNLTLPYVRDVRSGRFEMNSPYDGEGNLYASLAELKITFITRG